MLEQIAFLISEFGLDASNLTKSLSLGEEGIGFDSQEIIDFECMVEKKFKIKLPPQTLSKKTSIEELLKIIEGIQASALRDSFFQGKSEASLIIECSVEEAYEAIYEMEKWPERLPHVKRIEVNYNDGVYQEFLMDVISETGLIKVRSIRRCLKNDKILFFQPTPPKFLKNHCGGWSFKSLGNGCRVKTWHQWNLHESFANSAFPPTEELSTEERVENVLLTHAELALNTWKERLEAVHA